MAVKDKSIHATGKRKTAVARATIVKGSGKVRINNADVGEYITNEMLRLKMLEPLLISGLESKYDIKLTVLGGGKSSQIDALRQAIARALVEITGKEDLKKFFSEYDRSLLVSDTRFKETKKPNNSHARAKRQKSYR